MKRPNQNISFNLPKSDQIRLLAGQNHKVSPTLWAEKNIPASLLPIALEIIDTQIHLIELCEQYDFQWLSSKQKLVELNREECLHLAQLERSRKTAKEAEKLRRQKISKLTKLEKRFHRLTGKTPEEHLEETLAAFKQFMSAKKETTS